MSVLDRISTGPLDEPCVSVGSWSTRIQVEGQPQHRNWTEPGGPVTHYIEIDVEGLEVIEGRPGVFVVPNEGPLDLAGRLIGWGTN